MSSVSRLLSFLPSTTSFLVAFCKLSANFALIKVIKCLAKALPEALFKCALFLLLHFSLFCLLILLHFENKYCMCKALETRLAHHHKLQENAIIFHL